MTPLKMTMEENNNQHAVPDAQCISTAETSKSPSIIAPDHDGHDDNPIDIGDDNPCADVVRLSKNRCGSINDDVVLKEFESSGNTPGRTELEPLSLPPMLPALEALGGEIAFFDWHDKEGPGVSAGEGPGPRPGGVEAEAVAESTAESTAELTAESTEESTKEATEEESEAEEGAENTAGGGPTKTTTSSVPTTSISPSLRQRSCTTTTTTTSPTLADNELESNEEKEDQKQWHQKQQQQQHYHQQQPQQQQQQQQQFLLQHQLQQQLELQLQQQHQQQQQFGSHEPQPHVPTASSNIKAETPVTLTRTKSMMSTRSLGRFCKKHILRHLVAEEANNSAHDQMSELEAETERIFALTRQKQADLDQLKAKIALNSSSNPSLQPSTAIDYSVKMKNPVLERLGLTWGRRSNSSKKTSASTWPSNAASRDRSVAAAKPNNGLVYDNDAPASYAPDQVSLTPFSLDTKRETKHQTETHTTASILRQSQSATLTQPSPSPSRRLLHPSVS